MRKTGLALLVAGVIGLGATASPAAADQPSPPNCEGQFISFIVQSPLGPGRRAVADTIFGNDPHSVQTAEGVLQNVICG